MELAQQRYFSFTTIHVASTNTTGTLVGINFDNQSFDIGDPDRLRVKLNDRLMNRTRDLDRLYVEEKRLNPLFYLLFSRNISSANFLKKGE